ncbi:hypothetical protein RJT34_24911 [Clitoria ternatea]|uniref:Uncharacterized protein n=1 Tax=Clitoria ternatea TaxID=43366 RepID=A0AAN9FNS1_CLITE
MQSVTCCCRCRHLDFINNDEAYNSLKWYVNIGIQTALPRERTTHLQQHGIGWEQRNVGLHGMLYGTQLYGISGQNEKPADSGTR